MTDLSNPYRNSCIYRMVCINNANIFYIGSTTDLHKRKRQHRNACNNVDHDDYYNRKYCIMRELNGFENFEFNIIEHCNFETLKELQERENYYINLLKPVMNTKFTTVSDTRKEQMKEYNIRTDRTVSTVCECGGHYIDSKKSKHLNSHKHTAYLHSLD